MSETIEPKTIRNDSAEKSPEEYSASYTDKAAAHRADLKRKFEMNILLEADKARKRDEYLDYDYHVAAGDPHVKLFMARRIGKSHLEKKMPCQDYCKTVEVGEYTILTDADGVSACIYSDVGSKLACTAAIKVITDAINYFRDSEDSVVAAIKSVLFKERLVHTWISLVKEHIKESGVTPVSMLDEIRNYGSTIMFVVISPNYYICGNLGDGQVMVFNDKYGREDIIIESYPRSSFNGVLLTTDGMYDFLSGGIDLYRYAIQIKARFTSCFDTPEPLQPFCYMRPNEPLKDLSRHPRATDDCSIVLAVDDKNVCRYYTAEYEALSKIVNIVLPSRWSESCRQYFTDFRGDDYEVCAYRIDPEGGEIERRVSVPPLKSAVLEKPSEIITALLNLAQNGKNACSYSFYLLDSLDTYSLEYMFTHSKLRGKSRYDRPGDEILDVYEKYVALKKELESYDLMLNSAAHFLITYKDGQLHVKREAIIRAKPVETENIADSYFSALLGMLVCGDKRVALYDTGFLVEGRTIRECEFDETANVHKKIGCVHRDDKIPGNPYTFRNCSGSYWTLADGTGVKNGESIPLCSGMEIRLDDKALNKCRIYRYVSKEDV